MTPYGKETVTSARFNPVRWAVAIAIVAIFGVGVTYRVVTGCEPSQFEVLRQLKVTLGGCPARIVDKTERRESVSSLTAPRAVPARPLSKLYYNNRELNGATITLERSNPDPRVCTAMHLWATMPTGVPDSFAVCGVWMEKPDDAAGVTAFALYIDFSEEMTDRHGYCRASTEKPDPGYKVALVCPGWPTLSPARWTLPAFFGVPIPAEDTKVRMRFEYGKSGRAEATFVLRPPIPAPGASAEAARPSGDATLPPAGSSNTVSNQQAVQELQRLRATTKRITSSVERDEQLATVVRLAIQKREYRAAIDVAGDIWSSETRDKMLGDIACYALHRSGDRAVAEAAAAAVWSTVARDEVYRNIVTGATSKGEGNDIPCAKL